MSRLVNIRLPIPDAAPLPAPPQGDADHGGGPPPALAPGSVGVFITPQSIVTFPVASSMVTIVWKVLEKVFPAWGTSLVVPLVIALLVGFLIYLMSENPGTTTKAKAIGIGIAVLNSFTLAATALGISDAIAPSNPAGK